MTKKECTKHRYETIYKPAYDALMKVYPFSLEDLDGELWQDFNGYQISNFGRVKSFMYSSPQIVKPVIDKYGYLRIRLSSSGKRKTFLVHRLVAKAFIPNPDSKPEINHKDGHRLNNHVSNLEWATTKENIKHAWQTGLSHASKGEDNYQAGVTNEQVVWIRSVYIPNDKEFGATALAKKLGISPAAVNGIVRGRSYKSAGGKLHEKYPRLLPESLRESIRREYVRGSSRFGSVALAKKYGVSQPTILNIVHELR